MNNKVYLKLLKARRQLKRVELSAIDSLMVDNYREKIERLEKRLKIKGVKNV